MVILTVVTTENPHTVYFEPYPIPKPSYIRLLSCSLYNSWSSLENDGIVYYKKKGEVSYDTHFFHRLGNYSLDDIGDIFEKGFREKNMFSVEKGITGRSLIIKTKKSKVDDFKLNESLIKF